MATAQLGTLMRHIKGLAAGCAGPHRTDRQLLDDFASRRDESAFAGLVGRHGPMVLGACRRLLRHEQDAEDAFQATFLTLARHPGSVRRREALASWLYGVAYRTAMKAKRSAARRRNHEARLRDRRPPAAPSPTWDDVQAVLDEEIQRLPESFRSAFVFCVLDGKTVPAAAAELGVKEGTLSWRLARARQRLRQRLARRGIQLSAVLAALALAREAGRAAVPAALAGATVRFGLSAAAGGPAAAIPSHVAALAAGVTRAMCLSKAKTATALLVVLGLVVAGASALTRRALATPPEAAKPQAGARPSAAVKPGPAGEKDGRVEVRGRVLDPEGKPVPGAKLVFVYASAEKAPDKIWATSAADGGFQFSFARTIADPGFGNAWDHTYVVAAAEGHGFAWARVRPETAGDLTLRLVKDDVQIRGRVLDLQGKPVAGATVRIDDELLVPAGGGNGPVGADLTGLRSAGFARMFPPVKTGADGRFQVAGVGRERVATLRVEGPTIATQQVKAVTRPADKAGPGRRGVPFDLLTVPTRPVVGVVSDKGTGTPLAGVVIRSYKIGGAEDFNGLVRTTTDKEGRYRLVGLPKGQGNVIIAEPWGRTPRPEDLPYLAAVRKVGDAPGLGPVTVDVGLRRGVWVKGRVIDKATGKGVTAGFDYFCFGDNPFAADLPLPHGLPWNWTRKDGSFRVVALPGRGLLGVRASRDEYRMGVGAERIKRRVSGSGQLLDTRPYHLYPGNEHTIAEISPKAGDESITCDVYLDPGRTLTGTAVGPDGKPLAGARVRGLRPMAYWENEPLKTAEFTILGLGPDETRTLEMVQEEKKLAGRLVVRGDEKAPVRIRLEPWGVVTGRLVKPDGEPMTNVTIYAGSRGGQPDKEGKFRIDGLSPGLKFGLTVIKSPYQLEISGKDVKDLTLRPGETKDLGDIQVKPME
jgi:RNA polymerase sigma factor (sigma-70 family)